MNKSPAEIDKQLHEAPHKIIKEFEDVGMSFEDVKKQIDLGRSLVKSAFGMSEKDIEAVEFVFWIAYYAERMVQEMIISIEVTLGARSEAVEKIVEKLHFGDKISVISDLYTNGPKKDALVIMLWKINTLRNAVAHGRFSELIYSDFHLSDLKGQIKLTMDMKDAALSKSEMLNGLRQ